MTNNGSVLLIDRDSELTAILGSYLTALGYKVMFTNRVREALRKVANQRFDHIFVDPDLSPDNLLPLIEDLETNGSLNHKTPVTLMTFDLDYMVPMPHVKRISSILPKPFSLAEFAELLRARAENKQAG